MRGETWTYAFPKGKCPSKHVEEGVGASDIDLKENLNLNTGRTVGHIKKIDTHTSRSSSTEALGRMLSPVSKVAARSVVLHRL